MKYIALMTQTMPAIFFGHGSPVNALARNRYTEGWAAVGTDIPRPRAIVSVSAHWYRPGVAVTAMPDPPTIHDFGGFPRELHEFQYPARGDPGLARRVQALLGPLPDEGILVIGAGNIVHNLRAWTRGSPSMEPYDWAVRFERKARDLMLAGD